MSPIFPQPKGCGSETLHLTLRAPYFHQLRCIQRNGSFKSGYLKEFFGFDDSIEITAWSKVTGWITAGDQDLLDCLIPKKPNILLIFAACSIQRTRCVYK